MLPSQTKADGPHGNVIPGRHVHLIPGSTRVCVPAGGTPSEPKIILIRDGDAIQAIEVVCTCGERIRLNCIY